MFTPILKRREKEVEEEEKLVSRDKRHVFWSEDASAEKADRGEKFVELDREVRRYLFHAYFAEIESNGSQILIRGEYGDEKVDEEIVSRE